MVFKWDAHSYSNFRQNFLTESASNVGAWILQQHAQALFLASVHDSMSTVALQPLLQQVTNIQRCELQQTIAEPFTSGGGGLRRLPQRPLLNDSPFRRCG